MPTVIVQKWEESERGWGCRPDGYSIHHSDADREAFIDEYWARMPAKAPAEYSRPHGTPYTAEVTEDVAAAIKGNGTRHYDSNYPGDGGKDGWINR